MHKERWKPIEGHSTYKVSDTGRIMHFYKGKWYFMNFSLADGYYLVRIDGKTQRVHRLVALAFIPNPNNYPYVNHKDFNRINNFYENLEWCTPKYNVNYSICNMRDTKNTKIGVSGEKYISITNSNNFRVQIRLERCYFYKVFNSLKDAIIARNNVLKENNYEIKTYKSGSDTTENQTRS